jgi:hypothetical protein
VQAINTGPIRRLFARIVGAAKSLAGKLRPENPPAMIGTPPSTHERPTIPVDPAEHAVPGGRITVDSGVLNPELNAEKYGPQCASFWKKARLRDGIDSLIVHEYGEAKGVSHAEAIARAPDTELPVRPPGAGSPPRYGRG